MCKRKVLGKPELDNSDMLGTLDKQGKSGKKAKALDDLGNDADKDDDVRIVLQRQN